MSKIKSRELSRLGIRPGPLRTQALELARQAVGSGETKARVMERLRDLAQEPERFLDDPLLGDLASKCLRIREARHSYRERAEPATFCQFGSDLDANSIQQMENACRLPVSVRGALMPDAHVGYGLPIGGVLATRNAVIPYAVGVDIACRMKMTVLDLKPEEIERSCERLTCAIQRETRFGIGVSFKERRHHDVMDRDWSVSPITRKNRDKAWAQLGTSGSGNHFVEFGILEISDSALGLERGVYLALMSHSGSRGVGASVAAHYSRLAQELHPELPRDLFHLAWLDLDSEAGIEYWAAMQLMGAYAAANHACIHEHIARHLGAEVMLDIENHHNFAWREVHDGEEVIVHRKGATPADEGVVGIIPGSMATPAYVVVGRGDDRSLRSAAHGAGRVMSRTEAKRTLSWRQARELLEERRVKLLSAGLDEVPMVYKDIEKVMDAQTDLVYKMARFQPRLVKMAPAGERPED